MTAERAHAFSIEIDKTRSRLKQTEIGSDAQHSQLGIKAKLFLAFFSLAGLTVLASAIAWYVFRDIERAVTRVTVESVPGIINALSAAEKSAEIAAAAPTLMAVANQEERVLEEAKLEERARALATQIKDLAATKMWPEKTLAFSKIEQETTAKITELNGAVEKRQRLETERQAAVRGLSTAHANFLLAIESLIDDSVFNPVTRGEDVTAESIKAITDLVEGNVSRIDQLFTINAEGNLAAGLLTEAAQVGDPALIQPIREMV
jgi:phosphoglycerate-specific signal transduction histidine kinase